MNEAISISHLMYAYDVMLFTKANWKSLKVIDGILEEFNTFIELG